MQFTMSKTHELQPALTNALDQVLELVVLLGDDMQHSLAGHGLSLPRAHLLWLVHRNGPQTQRVLADALKVTPRNVTSLVDGLVDTGFVTRERHPTDRRATLVSLTDHGASTLAAMDESRKDLAELLFGDLSSAQLKAFLHGLNHVASRLREGLQAAQPTER